MIRCLLLGLLILLGALPGCCTRPPANPGNTRLPEQAPDTSRLDPALKDIEKEIREARDLRDQLEDDLQSIKDDIARLREKMVVPPEKP